MSDPLAAYRSGSTEPWTVNLLAALVTAKMPHVIIETGTYEGLTTLKFLEATWTYAGVHGCHIYTIESDPVRSKAAQAKFEKITGPMGCSVETVNVEALEFLSVQASESADFIFLDDDHSPTHVIEELFAVQRILQPGGICCVHDVVGPFGLGTVVRGFGGFVLNLPRLHAAGGLGIIAK